MFAQREFNVLVTLLTECVPVNIPTHPFRDSRQFDGYLLGRNGVRAKVEQAEELLPVGDPQDKLAFYVYGFFTPLSKLMDDMQHFSGRGFRVLGVHNATAGMVRDVAQTVGDKFGVGKNPAVDAVKSLLRQALESGLSVSLFGHSQGATICCRALWEVRDNLLDSGLSEEQAVAKLSLVELETAGGVSTRYPDGPAYRHLVNSYDPVPRTLGLNSPLPFKKPGEKAEIESLSVLRKPYTLPRDHWLDLIPNAVDRSVHGTEVYYGEQQAGLTA